MSNSCPNRNIIESIISKTGLPIYLVEIDRSHRIFPQGFPKHSFFATHHFYGLFLDWEDVKKEIYKLSEENKNRILPSYYLDDVLPFISISIKKIMCYGANEEGCYKQQYLCVYNKIYTHDGKNYLIDWQEIESIE